MNINNCSDEALITIFSLLKMPDFSNFICCKRFYELLHSKAGERIFEERSKIYFNKFLHLKLNSFFSFTIYTWFEFYKRIHCAISRNKNYIMEYIINDKLLEVQVMAETNIIHLKEICRFSVMYGKINILKYLSQTFSNDIIKKNIPHTGYIGISISLGRIEVYEWLIQYYPNYEMSYDDILLIAIKENHINMLKWVISKRLFSENNLVIDNIQKYYNFICKYDRDEFLQELDKYNCEYEISFTYMVEFGSYKVLKWYHQNRKVLNWPKFDEKIIDFLISKGYIEFIDYYNKNIHPNFIKFVEEGTILTIICNDRINSLKWLRNNGLLSNIFNIGNMNNIMENVINETIKYNRFEIFIWLIETFQHQISQDSFNYMCFNGNYHMVKHVYKTHNFIFDVDSENGQSIIEYIKLKIQRDSMINDIINYRRVLEILTKEE